MADVRGESFLLGVHRPHWLAVTDAPLFVSRVTIEERCKTALPVAVGRWALDSGGFTELDRFGGWTLSAAEYVEVVRRYRGEIGGLEWAAPQDWMCEPKMLAKTGLDVAEHQRRTVRNLLELRELDASLPFVPVLQGWSLDDYLRCIELYEAAGVELAGEPLVGLGTVCRRQATKATAVIVRRLAGEGLRLHGFGVKISGLTGRWAYADALASADSMAWSLDARWQANHGVPSCDPGARRSCANCLHFALEWRARWLPNIALRLWEESCAV